MKKDQINYEEWLTTIVNTRLVYNTMEELEQFWDNRSIHNNGIKRCFGSPQKLRSAYRDLKVEVSMQTDEYLNLDRVLMHYHRAWRFFRNHLYRRTNPEQIVCEILRYCYYPYKRDGIGAKKAVIYKQIIEQEVSVSFLILMLTKVIPGYDSKEGDVVDLPRQFKCVMDLLEDIVGQVSPFTSLPIITQARESSEKTRLILLSYVQKILDTYESFTAPKNLYDLSMGVKGNTVNLDIEGYWNECGGKLFNTDFWKIEEAINKGCYFITYWKKNAENKLTGIKYTLFIMQAEHDRLIYYLVHPEAIKHRMKGLNYGDTDHVWYKTDIVENTPEVLPLQRVMYSNVWPQKIKLTRCNDERVISTYERWLNHDCEIVKPYQHLEYEFRPNLYAVTRTHLYIPSENEGEYCKVPKTSFEGFECIQITDNVGTMQMNGKTYLAFDEFLLYINTSKSELKKYEIERVNSIE